MLRQYRLRFYDFRLVIMLLAISFFGVSLVGSAMSELQNRQLLGVVMGLVIMLIVSLVDYSWVLNFHWLIYAFNIFMLLAVRLFGSSSHGAARWIDIGFITFQPTELSKILIILFFAKYFMDHEDTLNTFPTLVRSAGLLFFPLFLVYQQPDLKIPLPSS